MPLTWSTEACDRTEHDSGTVETLCFASMFIGFDSITEKNVEALFVRIKLWEGAGGSLRRKYDKEHDSYDAFYFTLDELRKYVGLKTNAVALSNTKFLKSLLDYATRVNLP